MTALAVGRDPEASSFLNLLQARARKALSKGTGALSTSGECTGSGNDCPCLACDVAAVVLFELLSGAAA